MTALSVTVTQFRLTEVLPSKQVKKDLYERLSSADMYSARDLVVLTPTMIAPKYKTTAQFIELRLTGTVIGKKEKMKTITI